MASQAPYGRGAARLGLFALAVAGAIALAATGGQRALDAVGLGHLGVPTLTDARRAALELYALRLEAASERVWTAALNEEGRIYIGPDLALSDAPTIEGPCAPAPPPGGVGYCPEDRRLHLDIGLLNEVATRRPDPETASVGIFFAHLAAHHLQMLNGGAARLAEAADPAGSADARLRLELEADCLAGVWARRSAPEADAERLARAHRRALALERFLPSTAPPAGALLTEDPAAAPAEPMRARWFARGAAEGARAACDVWSAAADAL